MCLRTMSTGCGAWPAADSAVGPLRDLFALSLERPRVDDDRVAERHRASDARQEVRDLTRDLCTDET